MLTLTIIKILHDHDWIALRKLYKEIYVETAQMSLFMDQLITYSYISPKNDIRDSSDIHLLPSPDLSKFKEKIIADAQLVRLYKEEAEPILNTNRLFIKVKMKKTRILPPLFFDH